MPGDLMPGVILPWDDLPGVRLGVRLRQPFLVGVPSRGPGDIGDGDWNLPHMAASAASKLSFWLCIIIFWNASLCSDSGVCWAFSANVFFSGVASMASEREMAADGLTSFSSGASVSPGGGWSQGAGEDVSIGETGDGLDRPGGGGGAEEGGPQGAREGVGGADG